ncbi:hypothetical protein FB451DRAFT_1240161 [Mycena latifolia]|nr:hypothetical protein FB451DRAFT_1240161 [Mycena latifolia]
MRTGWINGKLLSLAIGKMLRATAFACNCWIVLPKVAPEDDYRKQLIVDNRMCFLNLLVDPQPAAEKSPEDSVLQVGR